VKIAYVGDFINHGKSLQTTGTPMVILLSLLENVDSIDVFCPEENEMTEEFEIPSKVILHEFYRYDNSKSILRLLKVQWKNYDEVIFNMLPTGFGKGTIANATALFIPILLVKLHRQKNIKVIYHNSVFTNDVRKLGYDTGFDKIRSFFLGIVEKILFKTLDTFVLLDLYKERIDKSIGENRVRLLKSRYLEAITSLYINKAMNLEYLNAEKSDTPTVLMHGSWGPQKNIELGLSGLKKLKENGAKFRLTISGGPNHHFPDYGRKFQELLHAYSDIVDDYLGPVSEKDIMKIFLQANILLLPYNTPGGHSGVLEQAIFFEIPTIAIDFPEYREQVSDSSNVKLVNTESFSSVLATYLKSIGNRQKINIIEKIIIASANVKELIGIVEER
jgi:glycosyltransferase involved in cell wall biosynthesis